MPRGNPVKPEDKKPENVTGCEGSNGSKIKSSEKKTDRRGKYAPEDQEGMGKKGHSNSKNQKKGRRETSSQKGETTCRGLGGSGLQCKVETILA